MLDKASQASINPRHLSLVRILPMEDIIPPISVGHFFLSANDAGWVSGQVN
jgi:hypothetical protein